MSTTRQSLKNNELAGIYGHRVGAFMQDVHAAVEDHEIDAIVLVVLAKDGQGVRGHVVNTGTDDLCHALSGQVASALEAMLQEKLGATDRSLDG